jgi:hypothetical protein
MSNTTGNALTAESRPAALLEWYGKVDNLIADTAAYADQFTLDRFSKPSGELAFAIVAMALAILLPLSIKFAGSF